MIRTSHEGPAIVLNKTSFASLYKTFAHTCVCVPIFDHKNKNNISKDDTVSQKKSFTHVKPFHPKLKIKPSYHFFARNASSNPMCKPGKSTLFWPGWVEMTRWRCTSWSMQSWLKHQVGAFAVKDRLGKTNWEGRGLPWKMNGWNSKKMEVWFRCSLFNWVILWLNANFQGCIYIC